MEPLRRIAVALEGSDRLWGSVAPTYAGLPAPGSQAEQEANEPDPIGHLVLAALATPKFQIEAMLDCTRGVAKLSADPAQRVSIETLARTIAELSSTVWWVEQPGIGPLERAKRGMRLRRNYLEMVVGSARRIGASGISHYEREITEIDKFGRQLKIDKIKKPPPHSQLAGLAMEAAGVAGTDFGRGHYGYLSGSLHGNPLILLTGYHSVANTSDPDERTITGRPRPDLVATTMAMAAVSMTHAISVHIDLYGWDRSQWDSWIRHIEDELHRALDDAGVTNASSDGLTPG